LVLREIDEVSHSLPEIFHLGNFVRLVGLAVGEVVLKFNKLSEGRARAHVSAVDQGLHILG